MPPPKSLPRVEPATTGTAISPLTTWIISWLVPGAGHAMHGQTQKAIVFFVVLLAMFFAGLGFGGRLLPLQMGDFLLFLAALAEWALGLPRLLGLMVSAGKGEVTSVTYEYGNTFLITAGLLNLLIAFNAYDLAARRKSES